MPIVLGPLLLDLGVILAVLVAFGLALVWKNTQGSLLHRALSFLWNTSVIGISLSSALGNIEQFVRRKIGEVVLSSVMPVAGFFEAAAHDVVNLAWTISNNAVAVGAALEEGFTVRIPRVLRAAVHPLVLAVAGIVAIEHGLVRDLHRSGTSLAKWLRSIAKTGAAALIAAELALRHSIAVDLPRAIPGLRTRVKEIEGFTRKQLARRLRRVEALLAAGLLAVVGLRAIARYAPWARCTNVNRTMRQLCRTPHNFLGDLLALTADFAILTNICRVLPWIETAFETVAAPMIEELTKIGAGICGASYERAERLDVPQLHLPPVTFTQLYLP